MNNNNPYNQPPMGQGMPQGGMMPPMMQQPQMGVQSRMLMRQRMIKGARRMQDVFPRWLSLYPIVTYILALMVVSFMYSEYSMPWYYMLSGVISIVVFFLYGSSLIEKTSVVNIRKTKTFEYRIFFIALIPRILWTIFIYFEYMNLYGDAFGVESADSGTYEEVGKFVAGLIEKGNFHFYDEIQRYTGNKDAGDTGFATYLGFIYWLSDNNIIVVHLLHCLWSTLTVLLIYRLAKRNFGEQTARIAAIFCALWPNFWYYCGEHLKEVEMVFLVVLFVEQADQMLRSQKITTWKVIPILLIAAALITFRVALGLVALLAILIALVLSSTKIITWGKRIIVGAMAVALIAVSIGDQIQEQASALWEEAQSDAQKNNMEWRANRKDASGNTQSFAKYASTAVFAPLIFTLPFPTMVRPFDGQNALQLLNGGYVVKNILSFFTILALISLLLTGKWREYVFPLAFLIGYLVVLAMSTFAQSERFHQPAMPFEFMFAAYGLSIAVTKKKYKRWFTYWCMLMFVAAIVWNWFKLAGRGLT